MERDPAWMLEQVKSVLGIYQAVPPKPEIDKAKMIGKLDEDEVDDDDLGGADYTPLPSQMAEWRKPIGAGAT